MDWTRGITKDFFDVSGMTQVVPTLPSGETPQPGTGGTGFSAPHLSKYNHISLRPTPK